MDTISRITRRGEQLALLSRLEWTVLRSTHDRVPVQRWFARVSADSPGLAIRLSRITIH